MPTTQDRINTRAGRFYEIDGVKYPSVTTILSIINKPALVNWAAKVEREMVLKVARELYEDSPIGSKMTTAAWNLTMDNRLGKEKASSKELAKAGEIGSQVHKLIEWTLKGELCYEAGPSPKISDKAQWAFMAWEDWRKSVKLKPLYVEQVVYSKEYSYAGTLDLVAEVNGVLTVIDWKTGKAVYGEAHLQNAAYRHAFREMGHGSPDRGLIVRLPKVESDPEFEVVEAKPEESQFHTFFHAFMVWEWNQQMDTDYQARKYPVVQSVGELTEILQKSIDAIWEKKK
jgi:hypothetical protein